MAIKVEFVTEHSKWLDGMRKIQDSVKTTTKTINDSFDQQAAAVEKLAREMEELAAEIDKAESAGDTKTVDEKRHAYEELGKELEKEKQAFEEMNAAFGKMGSGGGGGQQTENMRTRMRMLNMEIAELTIQYRNMSDAEKQSASGRALLQKINSMTEEAGQLRDVMGDVSRAVSGVASDTRGFDQLAGALNVATSAAGAYTGVLSMFGAKEEELAEIQTKLQASIAVSNALSQMQNQLQKESALMQGISIIQTKAETAAKALSTKGTVAATVAQKAFNLVAKANPYVLLATALVSVVGALYAFSKGAAAAKKKEEELAKAQEEAEEKVKSFQDTLSGAMMESMAAASTISNLQVAYKNANTEFEKTAILKQAAEQFNKLGLECNGVADAQRILVQQGDAVIEMLQLQGEVAALTALRMEAFKASFNRNIQNTIAEGGTITDDIITLARWEASGNDMVRGLDKQIVTVSGRLSAVKGKLRFRGGGGGGGRTTPRKTGGGGGGSNWNQAHANADAEEMMRDWKDELVALVEEVNQEIADANVESLEEGTEKTLRQIQEDEIKQLDAIQKQREDLIKKRRELDLKMWEKSAEGRDKYNFKAKSDAEYLTMIEAENPQLLSALTMREAQISRDATRRREEVAKQEADAMRGYLKQYGDYQQQRLAITEDYDEQIRKAKTEGDKLMLGKQKEEALRQVDERYGLVTQAMADLFADASKKSVKAIQAIIDKYTKLVEYMEGHKTDASDDELAALGLSQRDIERVKAGEISIKDLTDRLKELKGELQNRSPYQSFIGNMKVIIDKLKEAKNAADLGEAVGAMTAEIKAFLPAVKDFSNNVGNIFGADNSTINGVIDGFSGLMSAGGGIGQIMSGDIVGGVMNTVSGISQMVDAFDGLFGADYSSYKNLVDQYTRLISVWDTLIGKKKEYLAESYGADAMRAEKEAERLLANEMEAWRTLGRERLNSGTSAGSHSIGVRIRQKMTDADWSGVGYDLGGRLEGLFDLSAKQLEELRANAPTFWAKLDDDVRKYLENIINGAEQLEQIQEQARNQFTSTTFDSVYDSFVSSLADMDKSAYDFSKDFEKYMFNAVLNAQVSKLFKTRLEDWYKAFAAANEDGMLSESEIASLRYDYDQIMKEGIAMRDDLAKLTNYGSSGEGDATFRSVSSFTQEQGDILNGRLTAIQIGVQTGNVLRQQISNSLTAMNALVGGSSAAVDDMRDLVAMSNTHLADIVSLNKKMLTDFTERIDRIVINTQNL